MNKWSSGSKQEPKNSSVKTVLGVEDAHFKSYLRFVGKFLPIIRDRWSLLE